MMRQLHPLPLVVFCMTLCLNLHAQQRSSYTAPYEPIRASTVTSGNMAPAAENTLPAPLPATSGTPAMPSVNDARPLNPAMAKNLTTLIPLQLPGYELRVMDVTKRVTFEVNGQPVAAEVPVFVYMPQQGTQAMQQAAADTSVASADSSKELRKLYNDLIGVYNSQNVNKEQVRAMLKRLDGVIDTLSDHTPAEAPTSSDTH